MANPFDVFDSWGNKIGEITPPDDGLAEGLVLFFLWLLFFFVYAAILVVISPLLLLINGIRLYKEDKKGEAIACWVIAVVIALFVGIGIVEYMAKDNNSVVKTGVYGAPGNVIGGAANFSGKWGGSYTSIGAQGRGANASFEMEIKQNGAQITGVIAELDGSRTLTSKISGSIEGHKVRFIKQYDESPQPWPVEPIKYEGSITDDGNSIIGTWQTMALSGNWSVLKASGTKDNFGRAISRSLKSMVSAEVTYSPDAKSPPVRKKYFLK